MFRDVQMFKGWFKCLRAGPNVQGLVQMFKGWSKCSCVGGERSRVSERLRGNAQKLYLKWSLTARPIAKFNVLVCSYSVLVIPDDVLVSIVGADVVDKLLKLVYCPIVILLDGRAYIPIPGFASKLVHSPQDVVLI
jgi:hypothetical protein